MSEITEFIRSNALFKNCDDAFYETLAQAGQVKTYDKSKVLFINGDAAERFFMIKSGWVKLFRETLDGSQAVVDILTTRSIFGETAIFEDDVYPCSAEIVEKSEIISFPLKTLKTEIENNNKLAFDMLTSMARYRRQQDQEIEHRALQNAPQRIGCFLLRMANQNATGSVRVQLPYDKMLVASRLGMQPETFSRALNKLKDKTDMTIQGSTIEIQDIDQLVDFSCSACSSNFPCKDLSN
jgi:CRP-like cAMP-binding protein